MRSISWLNQYKIIRQLILDSLNESKLYAKGRMLDVGCGTKPYKEVFSDVVKEYIGIDYPSSISANKEPKNVEVYSILPHLSFKNESFDTVLATEVLEHVAEPDAAFLEINRVLKKQGVLILTAPQSWAIHEAPNDYYRYTRYGLSYLARRNGFEITYVKPHGGFYSLIGQRFSGHIFYSLAIKNEKLRSLALRALAHVMCMIVQFIFSNIDKLNEKKEDTIGNIMVARKTI